MAMECWDDDADFQGDFNPLGNSVGTAQTSISSRLSVHSESLAGDDDWNVVLQPNDELSTNQAIQSAKQAGIPLPSNIPSSALLGGTIKRLGKKPSRQKIGDDWDNDLEMPDSGLTLKPKAKVPEPQDEDFDDFDDLEGSLGTRFAGTKRDARNRSFSPSGMSPSLGSATAESEEDALLGLEFPEGPMDFDAILLKKRRAAEAELSDMSQASPAIEQPATMNLHKKSKLLADDNEDFLNDFDLGGGDILDNRKTRMNKNLKIKSTKPAAPAPRPATTINFHDKPTDKPMHMRSHLPRPVSGSKPASRLEPVFESDTPSRGARPQRKDLASAALAREAAAKRTLTKPARRRNFGDGSELEVFDDLPTSTTKESKFVKEPVARGNTRQGLRPAPSRTNLRDPMKRNLAIPDRMMTPAPPRTPASPTKGFHEVQSHTPSYLRDTAASRIARESKTTNNPRPRSEGPLMPLSTNWKAQIAARSPHTSPSTQRQKAKRIQPTLIKNMGPGMAKTEKGMVYNPQTLRWEGNENTLAHFEIPPPLQTPTPTSHQPQTSYMDHLPDAPSSSPPRPALIAPMQTTHGVQVNGGMVFDPRQMKWLKLKDGRDISGPLSPSVTDGEDEDDAFAGIDDLKEENSPFPGVGGGRAGSLAGGMASPVSMAGAGTGEVHEEFDLGPQFIRVQRDEEAAWRKRCEGWFPSGGDEPRVDDGRWRWAIREMVPRGGFQ
ncbi:hypothetical protein LTR85_006645 [Meristemomyces frigidus]|nr:hypothetical protein LTR85_006645 [Meristemomyces frigidus]